MRLEKLKKAMSALLFSEATCFVCGRELDEDCPHRICNACRKELSENDGERCAKCGRALVSEGNVCVTCRGKSFFFDRAFSAMIYEGRVREIVARLKYRDAKYFADFFSIKMYETFLQEEIEADVVIPVPMTRSAKFSRGYNQTELLAKRIASLTGLRYEKKAVVKRRRTRHQAGLGREQRAENLKGCFFVKDTNAVKGKRVLITDDVLTTGATADELAKTLKRAGADKVIVLTFCATSELRPD